MNAVIRELRQTIRPSRESQHGPLPPLLLAMTFVTGLVDAFSYLVLGHVFVANMTGNVVFLGFALAGAPDFSILDSGMALVSFGLGALVGGKLGTQLGRHRGQQLSTAAVIQAVILAAAIVLVTLHGGPTASEYRDILIVVLGVAMGIQNATARKLGVPDMTTTVLTLTITGIAADSTIVGGKGSLAWRRFVAVGAMLAGAFVGAALVIRVGDVYPLLVALIVVSTVAATSWRLGTSGAAWVHTTHEQLESDERRTPGRSQA